MYSFKINIPTKKMFYIAKKCSLHWMSSGWAAFSKNPINPSQICNLHLCRHISSSLSIATAGSASRLKSAQKCNKSPFNPLPCDAPLAPQRFLGPSPGPQHGQDTEEPTTLSKKEVVWTRVQRTLNDMIRKGCAMLPVKNAVSLIGCIACDKYTYDLYYTTSYYSGFLPNALAMVMAGIKDPLIMVQAKEVSMLIGEFIQIQDDFIDCFGDELDIKKIGTDIADGKCSWVMVTALERANVDQRKIILENYGKNDKDSIERVKKVYTQIRITNLYAESVKENRERIQALIQKFDPSFPKKIFNYTIKKLDKQYKIPC